MLWRLLLLYPLMQKCNVMLDVYHISCCTKLNIRFNADPAVCDAMPFVSHYFRSVYCCNIYCGDLAYIWKHMEDIALRHLTLLRMQMSFDSKQMLSTDDGSTVGYFTPWNYGLCGGLCSLIVWRLSDGIYLLFAIADAYDCQPLDVIVVTPCRLFSRL
jgi:hypothetical protein